MLRCESDALSCLQQTFVALSWTAVPNAVDYTAQLYKQASSPVAGDTVRAHPAL